MANSRVVTSSVVDYGYNHPRKHLKTVRIDWVANNPADATENFLVDMPGGFILNVITNPDTPAPTASYDVELGSPEDAALDVLGGKLVDRSATLSEIIQPVRTNEATPVFITPGIYTLKILNNAVNSAQGSVIFQMVEAN